jgi:hypothetical protein
MLRQDNCTSHFAPVFAVLNKRIPSRSLHLVTRATAAKTHKSLLAHLFPGFLLPSVRGSNLPASVSRLHSWLPPPAPLPQPPTSTAFWSVLGYIARLCLSEFQFWWRTVAVALAILASKSAGRFRACHSAQRCQKGDGLFGVNNLPSIQTSYQATNICRSTDFLLQVSWHQSTSVMQ